MTRILFWCLLLAVICLNDEWSRAQIGDTAPPKLQISAVGKITDPFAVDEKGILKLNEIMMNRITDGCPVSLFSYAVQFSDDSSYRTDSLQPIFQEVNKSPRTITQITMEAKSVRPCIEEDRPLLFKHFGDRTIEVEISNRSYSPGLSYKITGDKRDWVFLTQSDVSDKLTSFGTTYYLPRTAWHILIGLASSIFFYFAVAFIGRRGQEKKLKEIDPALTPLTLKKYIFDSHPMMPQLLLTASLMIGFFVFLLSTSLIDFLLPSGSFLIGDEIKRYEQLSSYRSNVLSGILGLLIIPVLIDVVKNRIFKRST